MSEANRFTYIAITVFTLLFISEYLVFQNRLQAQNQVIESLQLEISHLNSRLSTYAHQLSNLETSIHEEEEKKPQLNVTELPGFRVISSENFEGTENGSLPYDWTQIKGTEQDLIFVTESEGYASDQCLQLVERGDDGDNCKVRYDIEDVNSSMVFSVYLKVMGYEATRTVIHFVNEDNITFASINCLLDYSWGNRGPEYWEPINTLPVPAWGEWYHLQIVFDRENQRILYMVDDFYSDWMNTTKPWRIVTAVDFRGNYNYPAVSRYDDVTIAIYDN